MKRNFGACIVAAVLIFSIVTSSGLSVVYAFSGAGSGTEADPYIITTVAQLQEMNNELDAWYVLGNDINASETLEWDNGKGFKPIGDTTTRFTGHFDGQGYVIYDLYINRPLEVRVGLFGLVGDVGVGADIQNVGLVDVDITGEDVVGGFVGRNYGTISSCYSTGSVSGNDYVGGFVGSNYGTITSCCSTATVNGNRYVGGFVGQNKDDGSISDCQSTGTVSGNGRNVGGFVGQNYMGGSISNCLSTGSVSGDTSSTGGFVGLNYTPSPTTIIFNCYSTGSVSGDYKVGGFVGENYGIITSCYSTGSVSGDDNGGDDNIGGFAGESFRGSISNCYSTGSASGDNRVGGFTGENDGCSISNCYSTGKVSGNTNVGGFVGEKTSGTITGCYWDKDTSDMTTSPDGGVGKTTVEMKKQDTFTGWDFTSIWSIIEDVTYPELRGMPEETVCGYVRLAPVGGISTPINKLEILTPYLALAGLIAALSTFYVIKRRKD